MTTEPRDLAASIRERLLNHARAEGVEFNYVLRRYANERFLYRLSRSSRQEQLVLKGANVFLVWSRHGFRQSRDVDLLGRELPIEDVERCMREASSITCQVDEFRVPFAVRCHSARRIAPAILSISATDRKDRV